MQLTHMTLDQSVVCEPDTHFMSLWTQAQRSVGNSRYQDRLLSHWLLLAVCKYL